MESREACERRAWRLAALLTGDARAADAIVAAALRAQGNLASLPAARLDRLVILRARDIDRARRRGPRPSAPGKPRAGLLERLRAGHHHWRGGALSSTAASDSHPPNPHRSDAALFTGPAAEAHQAAMRLKEQSREAWLLRELDGKDEIASSRAMDCSRTALERHLAVSASAMRESLGDRFDSAIQDLRRQAAELDPGPFVAARRSRARTNRTRRWAILLLILAALAAGAWAAWRWWL